MKHFVPQPFQLSVHACTNLAFDDIEDLLRLQNSVVFIDFFFTSKKFPKLYYDNQHPSHYDNEHENRG